MASLSEFQNTRVALNAPYLQRQWANTTYIGGGTAGIGWTTATTGFVGISGPPGIDGTPGMPGTWISAPSTVKYTTPGMPGTWISAPSTVKYTIKSTPKTGGGWHYELLVIPEKPAPDPFALPPRPPVRERLGDLKLPVIWSRELAGWPLP